MWPYWLMFLLPAAFASTETYAWGAARTSAAPTRFWTPGWTAATVLIALMMGYRFEVGGDWLNYLRYVDMVRAMEFNEVLGSEDPGFLLLNWISIQMEWDIVGVNVMAAIIFTFGLMTFCRTLPRPWLGLAVAIPYLVIVVGMGYMRQGIALALSMAGIVALQNRKTYQFIFWVALGATFHKTAVLLLPIGALAHSERLMVRVILVGLATVGGYMVLLADQTDALYSAYIESEYQSEGALVRLLMNGFPAAILIMGWKRFRTLPAITPLWLWFGLMSLGLLVILYYTAASTAVDRVALYMLPLQLVVFASLPDAMAGAERRTRQWVTVVLAYYALVLFVWLNFATHAEFWLPYRFYPFEVLT